MRVAVSLALGLVLAAAPALAKGPPWQYSMLEKPRLFGNMQLAAGEIALLSDGRVGRGTLASPLAVSTSLELPAGATVVFGEERSSRTPYWPMSAFVLGSFLACGFELGPELGKALPSFLGVEAPPGYANVGFEYLPEAERRAHPDQVSFRGALLRAMSAMGLNLPAGSQVNVRCDQSGATLQSWSGTFERDSDVGGALLRAGEPAAVSFGVHGPYATVGTLARAYTISSRLLPAGTRLLRYPGGMIALCGNGKGSMLSGDNWTTTECGDALAIADPARPARRSAVPAPRWYSSSSALLGSGLALLGALASLARLRFSRRAKV